VFRFEGVVSDHTEAGHADMCDGNPTLEFVVPDAMHPVGESDRGDSTGGFQSGESSRVVDDIVGKQNLLSSPSLKIAGGGVIEPTEYGDSGEQYDVGVVPEAMRWSRLRQFDCVSWSKRRILNPGLLSGSQCGQESK
jgi:hypothetical protein